MPRWVDRGLRWALGTVGVRTDLSMDNAELSRADWNRVGAATSDNTGRVANARAIRLNVRNNIRINTPPEHSVLFVCLGNICRSPTAEAVFRAQAARAGLEQKLLIDSAGIGDWHVGQPPDNRAIAHGRRRGYDLSALRARQVVVDDFARFDWILAMDLRNLRDLKALCPPTFGGHLGLFLDLVPGIGQREVPDPYFGGASGFETVLELAEQASEALLSRIADTQQLR